MKNFSLKFLKIIGIFFCITLLITGIGFNAAISKAAQNGSYLSLTINIIDKDDNPIEYEESLRLIYSFSYTSEAGNKGTNTTYQSIVLSGSAIKGTYTWKGNVKEIIKPNSIIYLEGYTRKTGNFSSIERLEYTENKTNYSFTVKVAKHEGTEDWESGVIYAESDFDSYGSVSRFQWDNDYQGHYTLWAGGGRRSLPNGLNNYNNSIQFWLRETFDPLGSGTIYMNSTKSRQIVWIATTDNKCPTSSKQKSDTSVVKVRGGKVTAVAPGTAYIWACRISQNDKQKVQVNETASVCISVRNAPSSISLTDLSNSETPLKKLNMGVGEKKSVYINSESKKGDVSYGISYYIRVTKGSNYIGVYDEDSTDEFDFVPSITTTSNTFYIKALDYNAQKRKPVNATIVVSNIESGKTAALQVTINNGIVEVANESNIEKLIFNANASPQRKTISSKEISNYVTPSALKYVTVPEGTINPFINEPTTDNPKVFVASGAKPSIDQIINKGKIKFSGNKSKNITARYVNTTLTIAAKKNSAQESGYVILAFNPNSSGNGILMIPYEIKQQ